MPFESSDEPVLTAEPSRLTLFPIKFHAIWRFYRWRAESAQSWALDPLVFDADLKSWESPPSPVVRHTIIFYIDLMLRGHQRMFDGLYHAVLEKITCPEVRCVLELFISKENVQADALYRAKKAFVDAMPPDDTPPFVYDDDVLEGLLEEKLLFTSVSDDSQRSVVDGLLILASAKRVFSFSIYSVLQWILVVNNFRLPGLLRIIERIELDADSFVHFISLVLCHMPRRPPYEQFDRALSRAVSIEHRFAKNVISPADVDPLSAWITHESMKDYINYVAHTFYQSLGHRAKIYWPNSMQYPWMNHTEGRGVAFILERAMENAYSEEVPPYTDHPIAGKGLINEYSYPPPDNRPSPVTSEHDFDEGDCDDDYDMETL
ncbi:hypothetical protein CVT26_001248 [Gymnopilus dilepis]|uniref:Uncharacterized protein n=1 Tax=Gymnopilus dilepis TaxID=231916 RepID=A0A409Y1Z5_9AGAR|nr:hypothetical protein CVT26_001248 [Gymnopilus dilepis]